MDTVDLTNMQMSRVQGKNSLVAHCLHADYDVIIHSDTWAEHMQWVAMVLTPARLTATQRSVQLDGGRYSDIGCHLAGAFPNRQNSSCHILLRTKIKKEVRQFLRLASSS